MNFGIDVDKMNILFIIVDALRKRNLSCYGYNEKTSPTIDNLADKGVLFENAYSCTNSTDASLTTIFSGRYPSSHGIISHGERIGQDQLEKVSTIPLLSEILRSHGYTTLAVDWLGRWHKRGYDFYGDNISRYRILVKIRQQLRALAVREISGSVVKTQLKIPKANAVTKTAIELLRHTHKMKFFLFIHYWDTHIPYSVLEEHVIKFYRKRTNRKKIAEIFKEIDGPWGLHLKLLMKNVPDTDYAIACYDSAIAFVDSQICRILETIEGLGLSDDILLILTSDHGESLTEHGIYFDHHGLYDVSIQVPLIFWGSVLPKGRRIKGFVQHVDILPTILDLLNISKKCIFEGKSMLPLMEEGKEIHSEVYAEEAYTERKMAIRTRKYKYIYAPSLNEALCRYCNRIHGGLEELYDLDSDPEEERNIAEEERHTVHILRRKLQKWFMLRED